MAPTALQGFFEGQGGAIYNRGDITVEDEALFLDNISSVRVRTGDGKLKALLIATVNISTPTEFYSRR